MAKLPKEKWGYVAQYETKIYFEKLEEENLTMQALEANLKVALEDLSPVKKARNLLQKEKEELEKEKQLQKESAIALKKANDLIEETLTSDLKAAQRETITAREMAVEERKAVVEIKKEAAVHTAPLSTPSTLDLQ